MRLQTSSAGLAIGDADNRYLRLAGGTMTGELNALAGLNTTRPYSSGLVPAGLSDPPPSFPFVTEFNNAGKNWTAVRVSVTNTASGSGSKLLDLQRDGISRVSFDLSGNLSVPNGFTIGASGSYFQLANIFATYIFNGAMFYGNVPIQIGRLSTGGPVSAIEANSSAVFSWNADTGLARNAAGVFEINNGTPGTLRDWKARRGSLSEYLDITEMSAPAAPAANTARLYVEDNGSGKTRLMVLFPTGAAQVLATEP